MRTFAEKQKQWDDGQQAVKDRTRKIMEDGYERAKSLDTDAVMSLWADLGYPSASKSRDILYDDNDAIYKKIVAEKFNGVEQDADDCIRAMKRIIRNNKSMVKIA